MGALSLAFGLFQARVADLSERRSQRALRATLAEMLDAGAGFPRGPKGEVIRIPTGSPVGFLEIPRIGVRKVLVEGAGAESLKKGPGVTSSSVLPGQPGQSVVVGRRTTYGAPFRHLDALTSGDAVKVTTPFGRFLYTVRETRTVNPGDASQLGPVDESVLTLVTSDPPYVGDRALVVVAALQGSASTFIEPPRSTTADAGSFSFGGNAGSEVGAVVTGAFFLLGLLVADTLYRRWRRWPTYLLTTPILLALLFAWMQNLTSIFPASL
jgi:sortase A